MERNGLGSRRACWPDWGRATRAFCALVVVSLAFAAAFAGARASNADEEAGPSGPYAKWERGPGRTVDTFPIGVWLQAPRNASKYREIGINLYVGLWKGPTEEQLSLLERHRMPVICHLDEYGETQIERKIIVGWMHGDEPDNAQSLGQGRGYGPPVRPEKIVADYEAIRARDPSRPVLVNLGKGVAWDAWRGRGTRTNHPEDYPRYVRGADIVSFDIYPVVDTHDDVRGKLWYVARGVKRLCEWTEHTKPVWAVIECTRISNPDVKPTPEQVKAEAWMAIVHGARGIVYFAHQFQPRFIEAALLTDQEMCDAIRTINQQISALAPVINAPPAKREVRVEVEPSTTSRDLARLLGPAPVATLLKTHGEDLYLFAVRMEPSPSPVQATFEIAGLTGTVAIEVLHEGRTLGATNGRFEDRFGPHDVHLYRIAGGAQPAGSSERD